MTTIGVNEILIKLIDENKRLKECLKVLVEYKSFVDLIVIKMKSNLDSKEFNKFKELNENIKQVFISNNLIKNVDQNNDLNTNIVKIEGKKVNENTSKSLTNNLIQTSDETTTHLTTNNTKTNANIVNTESKVNKITYSTRSNKSFKMPSVVTPEFVKEVIPSDKTRINMKTQMNANTVTIEKKVNKIIFERRSNNPTKKSECVQELIQSENRLTKLNHHYYCSSDKCNKKLDKIDEQSNDESDDSFTYCPNNDKPFRCNTCAKEFRYKNKLKRHIRGVHTLLEVPLICDINDCKKVFYNEFRLKTHQNCYHLKERLFSCDYPNCSVKCVSPSVLNIHKVSHTNERPFVCDLEGCSLSFKTKYALNNHKISHSSECKYICDYEGCAKRFKSSKNLKKHIMGGHTRRKIVLFKCEWPGCEYSTRSKTWIKSHQLIHTNIRNHICEECGKAFKWPNNLKVHSRIHTNEGDPQSREPLICGINDCKKVFDKEYKLKLHQNNYHLKKRRFAFDYPNCSFKCVSPHLLNVHKVSHSNERPFVCDFEGCSFSFKSSSSLKIHKLRHSSDRKFKCLSDGCGKCFKDNRDLRKHTMGVHSDNKFSCEWPDCEYKTPVKGRLKNHYLIHTNVRNYVCDWPQCGKAYKNLSALKLHLRIHTNDKRYACHWPGCEYRCVISGNLTKHMIVHQK